MAIDPLKGRPGNRSVSLGKGEVYAAGSGISARQDSNYITEIERTNRWRDDGLKNIGKSLGTASENAMAIAVDWATTQGREQGLWLQQQGERLRAYANTLQGEKALDPETGIMATMAQLNELYVEGNEKLKNNPLGRRLYNQEANKVFSGLGNWAIQKVFKEQTDHENNVDNAIIDSCFSQIAQNLGDYTFEGEQTEKAKQTLIRQAERNGWSQEEFDQKWNTLLQTQQVQNATTLLKSDQLGPANKYIIVHKDTLGEKAGVLRAMCRDRARAMENQRRLDEQRKEADKLKQAINDAEKEIWNSQNLNDGRSIDEIQKECLTAIQERVPFEMQKQVAAKIGNRIQNLKRLRNAEANQARTKFAAQTKRDGLTREQSFDLLESGRADMQPHVYDAIFKMLNTPPKTTEKNVEAYDALLAKIAACAENGDEFSEEDIDAYSYENDLTLKQTEDAKKFKKDGQYAFTTLGSVYSIAHNMYPNKKKFPLLFNFTMNRAAIECGGKKPTQKELLQFVSEYGQKVYKSSEAAGFWNQRSAIDVYKEKGSLEGYTFFKNQDDAYVRERIPGV